MNQRQSCVQCIQKNQVQVSQPFYRRSFNDTSVLLVNIFSGKSLNAVSRAKRGARFLDTP